MSKYRRKLSRVSEWARDFDEIIGQRISKRQGHSSSRKHVHFLVILKKLN